MARPTYYDQIWLSARHNADLTSRVELSNDVFEVKVPVDVYVRRSDMRLSCAIFNGLSVTLDITEEKAPKAIAVSSNISVAVDIQEGYGDYIHVNVNPSYSPSDLKAFTMVADKNTPAHYFTMSVRNEQYWPENASMSVLTVNILPNDLQLIGSDTSLSDDGYIKLIANMSCDFLRRTEYPQLYFAEEMLSVYEDAGELQFAKILNGDELTAVLSVNSPSVIKNRPELSVNSPYLEFYTDATFSTKLASPYQSSNNRFFYKILSSAPTTDVQIQFQLSDRTDITAAYDLRIMTAMQIEPQFKLAPNVEFDGKDFTIWLESGLTGDAYNSISVYSDISYDISFIAEKTREMEI